MDNPPDWVKAIWDVVSNNFSADITIGLIIGFLSGICTLAFGNK